MSKIINTVAEFKNAIEETCLIDFYTDNCPVCKTLEPVIESIESDIPIYKFKIDGYIVNQIKDICVVMSVPTIIIFKEGKSVFTSSGFINKDELTDIISVYK